MKAIAGRVYAHILNGKVHRLFTAAELPEWADASDVPRADLFITALDVTGNVPGEGYSFAGDPQMPGSWVFTPPAAPIVIDPRGFLSDVAQLFGGPVALNAIAKQYPALIPALQTSDYATVQALIINAQATAAITGAQYNQIKTFAAARHLPIALP